MFAKHGEGDAGTGGLRVGGLLAEQQALEVARDDVHLEVDGVAGLLQAEGGVANSEEFGRLLGGISRQAVDKRRRSGRVLALRERGDWLYPRWQIADGQALAGLEEVLDVLTEREHDPWAMLIFFLRTDTALEGESPLAALRFGRVEAAVEAARGYGEQSAR